MKMPQQLTARCLNQLTYHFPDQSDFLIGLSGGVDSVVLLDLFAQLRESKTLNLRAIHIHHGLSENADSWAAFCKTLCQQYDIPLIIEKVKVEGKQGLEANARQARYQAIQSHIRANEVLVTAHHQDDQVETFLLALKRGSGIKGLGAMQAVSFLQKMPIFRPLLAISKQEILDYAQQRELVWIEDESNQRNDFDRNFLRNQVLPLLNQRWEQFNPMVARASRHCAEQQLLIEELLAEELATRFNPQDGSLSIAYFAQCSQLKQQQLIRLWLQHLQVEMPSQVQLTQILDNLIFAEQDKNPQVKLGDKVVRRYQERIFVVSAVEQVTPCEMILPPQMDVKFSLPNEIGTIIRTADSIICKKSDKIDRLLLPKELRDKPLTLKLNHSGKVKCYGKPHREEMKKIWQKNSVPVWQRTSTPLVFFEEQFVGLLRPIKKRITPK